MKSRQEIERDIIAKQEFYGIPCAAEDIYPPLVNGKISKMNDTQILEYIEQVKRINREKGYDLKCFYDDDFIVNLINNVDMDAIEKYMVNTSEYLMHHPCDKQFVLCFRRAIPSDEAITENFWSTDFNEISRGLSLEISGEQRTHSVINVTTLAELEKHGTVTTGRGVSDGEVVIDPNKAFSSFLFRYKPWREIIGLVDFLENGGISREELISELNKNRKDKMQQQGLSLEDSELDRMLKEKEEKQEDTKNIRM